MVEAQAIAGRLERCADEIVKAWDARYAPEGIGEGIIIPQEVVLMREAATFLRNLPTHMAITEKVLEVMSSLPGEVRNMHVAKAFGLDSFQTSKLLANMKYAGYVATVPNTKIWINNLSAFLKGTPDNGQG